MIVCKYQNHNTLQQTLILSLFFIKIVFTNSTLFAATLIETPLYTEQEQIVVGFQIQILNMI